MLRTTSLIYKLQHLLVGLKLGLLVLCVLPPLVQLLGEFSNPATTVIGLVSNIRS